MIVGDLHSTAETYFCFYINTTGGDYVSNTINQIGVVIADVNYQHGLFTIQDVFLRSLKTATPMKELHALGLKLSDLTLRLSKGEFGKKEKKNKMKELASMCKTIRVEKKDSSHQRKYWRGNKLLLKSIKNDAIDPQQCYDELDSFLKNGLNSCNQKHYMIADPSESVFGRLSYEMRRYGKNDYFENATSSSSFLDGFIFSSKKCFTFPQDFMSIKTREVYNLAINKYPGSMMVKNMIPHNALLESLQLGIKFFTVKRHGHRWKPFTPIPMKMRT